MKRHVIGVYSAMLAAMVLVVEVLTGCQGFGRTSLKDLKSEDKYQYSNASWNSSAEEVKDTLPFSIVKNEERVPEEKAEEFSIYTTEDTITLNGIKAKADFEFYKNRLHYLRFRMETPEEGYQELYDEQVKELTELYGPETEKVENSGNGISSTVYRWKSGRTVMQVSLVTGENIFPAMQISLRLT